jgi:hypothetical protein
MYRFLIRSSRINSARALSLARKQVSDLGRGLHEHADDALVSAAGRKVTPHLPRPQYAPPRGGQQFPTSQLSSGRNLLELNSATLDSARCRDHRTSHYFPLLPLRNLREVCHRTTVDPPPPRVVSMWGKMIIRGQLVELLSTLALVNSPSVPALGLRA